MSRGNRQAEDQFYEKRRAETRNYTLDWSRQLDTGEVLSGNPTVTVVKITGQTATDASSELNISNQTTSGTKSVWTFGAATTGEQDEDDVYYVIVKQSTDASHTFESIHRLYVYEFGDNTAP
jgi:hypothetical protein